MQLEYEIRSVEYQPPPEHDRTFFLSSSESLKELYGQASIYYCQLGNMHPDRYIVTHVNEQITH